MQVEAANRLDKALDDPRARASFDSLEGAHAELSNKDKQTLHQKSTEGSKPKKLQHSPFVNFVREQLPIYGYVLASTMHVTAGLSKALNFLPQFLTEFFDRGSLLTSKSVNVLNYTLKGCEALLNNRAWDGLGRLAYSAVVPFVNLEDVFLTSGISSGITMFEQGQRHKVKNTDSLLGNFFDNSKAFIQMLKEIFESGLGRDRKIFISQSKEKGHTMFLSAQGNFFGALLGILAGRGRGPLKQFASLVRNLGGIGCDWAKFIHPDINNQLSAYFYGVVSLLDVAQAFSSERLGNILSHFSLAFNNFANYFYVNTTKATTDNEFQDYQQPSVSPMLQAA